MTEVSEDTEVKVASAAAEQFVQTYYQALNNVTQRSKLTTFYIKPDSNSPLQVDISLNGNILSDPDQLQSFFENQVARTHYEVGSFDCQVINTNFNIGTDESRLEAEKDGKKMSILVVVSGSVRYWKDGEDSETRGFTENIVLVPNWAAQGPKAAKNEKKWLIQSQTFRLVL